LNRLHGHRARSRLLVAALALCVLGSCGGAQDELLIVTPAVPIDADVMRDLGHRLNEHSEFTIRMTDESLTDELALDALASGNADIALISNNMPFREGVAAVMPLFPSLLHIAYRSDRDTTTPATLIKGARVFAGLEGSASRLVFERLIRRFGIGEQDFSYVRPDAADVDVVVIFAPIFPERIEGYSDFRLLSIGRPEEIGSGGRIDAAVLLTPAFRHFVIPEGTYGDITPEAVVTVAVDRLLVARNDLPDTVVYDFINEVLRLKPPMAARWPGLFADLSEDFDVSRSSFNLHAGTQDYLQRSAPTVYERYSGVAEVAVTLVVAIFSASVAGVRIYHRYRKNRIDGFCMRAIELRQSVAEDASYAERKRAIQTIHDLQIEAFELLADEKLAADESFQIFITLSNDVIRQIENHRPAGSPRPAAPA
jgi:TRAP-type uncharacterized transport system substrate-binding protein